MTKTKDQTDLESQAPPTRQDNVHNSATNNIREANNPDFVKPNSKIHHLQPELTKTHLAILKKIRERSKKSTFYGFESKPEPKQSFRNRINISNFGKREAVRKPLTVQIPCGENRIYPPSGKSKSFSTHPCPNFASSSTRSTPIHRHEMEKKPAAVGNRRHATSLPNVSSTPHGPVHFNQVRLRTRSMVPRAAPEAGDRGTSGPALYMVPDHGAQGRDRTGFDYVGWDGCRVEELLAGIQCTRSTRILQRYGCSHTARGRP